MSAPVPYPPQQQIPGYGAYAPPPPRKRGTKRIVFGALGILANAIGLVVMPIVAGIIGSLIAAMGMLDLTATSPQGGTVEASSMHVIMVAVPTEEAGSATCTVDGTAPADLSAEDVSSDGLVATLDGREYTVVQQVTVTADQTLTVDCEGASAAAVSEMGMTGVFVSLGIGILVPVLLGLVAIALLIWGIIARVRS